MSEKKQMLEIQPPEYDTGIEKKNYTDFACPGCNGNGWIIDWDVKRDDPASIGCTRCGGSGRLKAEITVKWIAEEKKS
jgi:predicted RNA-binding Zn-ribbon protein involved in translation (DUF1610 family)